MTILSLVRLGVRFCLLFILTLSAVADQPKPSAARFTINLRDGSRLVGVSSEKYLHLHSALLGEIKLPVQEVQKMESLTTNSLRLTTVDNDQLTVSFMEDKIPLETSFGEVTVTVDAIRTLMVATNDVGNPPTGLVALWPGENNGQDSIGHHDAELDDVGFAAGKIGQAFSFNGYSSWASVPASPDLESKLAAADGFTLSAWINPGNVDSFHPIFEWEVTKQKNSVSLWLGRLPHDRGVLLGGVNEINVNHQLTSPPGTIVAGRFQHVAMTYDKKTGIARLFAHGRIVVQENIGLITPSMSGPIFISRQFSDQPGDWTYNSFFSGLLDEVAIYDRALSPEEIKTLAQGEDDESADGP